MMCEFHLHKENFRPELDLKKNRKRWSCCLSDHSSRSKLKLVKQFLDGWKEREGREVDNKGSYNYRYRTIVESRGCSYLMGITHNNSIYEEMVAAKFREQTYL